MNAPTETMKIPTQSLYYVVFCVTKFSSFQEAKKKAPDAIAAHIQRSKELQKEGVLFMSGAFIDNTNEPLSTMGILISREAAQEYMKGDPFVIQGLVEKWHIREWANMFFERR